MSNLVGTEVVEREIGRWAPSDLAFIRELRYDGDRATLEIEALFQPRLSNVECWPNRSGPFWRVTLQFEGIRQLRIAQNGTGDLQVGGFLLRDHSSSQMEGVTLQVADYENGVVGFWALRVVVKACERLDTRPTSDPLATTRPGPA